MNRRFPADREEKREMLLAAAEGARESITRGAQESEELARLPGPTVEALDASGLLAMRLPAALGGGEVDPMTHFEVIEAVTGIDPAAGWCTMIWSNAGAIPAAFLPDEAIEQMFAGAGMPRTSGAITATSRAVPVDGGYVVNGRWSYASGIHHSQWLLGGTVVDRDGEGDPAVRMIAFPAGQAQVHENWQVAGLRGTGSCDFSVTDLFVPKMFVWDMLGGQPQRGGPSYRIGMPGSLAYGHAAFALGVGRLALDTILEQAPTKSRGFKPSPPLAQRPAFQRSMGQCDLRLRAARSLALEILEEAWAEVCEKGGVEPRLQGALRSSALFATDAATEVVSTAFRYGGASAVFESSMLQRCLRDSNAGAQHLVLSDTAYEIHGQFALGLPDPDPLG